MNKDGVWELVADAEVTNNGEHLKFSVDSFSPFAIVVNTDDNIDTGVGTIIGNGSLFIIIAIIVIGTVIAIIIVQKNKKRV
jgi:hypothetical protein